MQKALTPMREAFAQAVAEGKAQAEAYRIAFPKSVNWKNATVWKRSGELMKDGAVLGRVEEIKAQLAERGLWTREQSVKVLAGIAAQGEKDADRVRAVAELNAMHGFDAPKKIEHSGGIGGIKLIIEGVEPDAGN